MLSFTTQSPLYACMYIDTLCMCIDLHFQDHFHALSITHCAHLARETKEEVFFFLQEPGY